MTKSIRIHDEDYKKIGKIARMQKRKIIDQMTLVIDFFIKNILIEKGK